jgi:hypothetical protein
MGYSFDLTMKHYQTSRINSDVFQIQLIVTAFIMYHFTTLFYHFTEVSKDILLLAGFDGVETYHPISS